MQNFIFFWFVDILPDPGSLIVAEPLDLNPGPEHCLQLINISVVPAGFELFWRKYNYPLNQLHENYSA